MVDLKDLPPEERIKKLKELEEEKKKEIEDAEALIRDSMREIGEANEKRHAPLKSTKAADISQLVTEEEKQIFKTARFESDGIPKTGEEQKKEDLSLEEVAEEEAQHKKEAEGHMLYGDAVDRAKEGKLYDSNITTTGSDDSGKDMYMNKDSQGDFYKEHGTTDADKPQDMYAAEAEGSLYAERKKQEEEPEHGYHKRKAQEMGP